MINAYEAFHVLKYSYKDKELVYKSVKTITDYANLIWCEEHNDWESWRC